MLYTNKNFWVLFVTLLIVLALSFFYFLATNQYGIGIRWDGSYYFDGARKILDGHGYSSSLHYHELGSIPITHFPPLTSTLIALGGTFSNDLFAATRWLFFLLFLTSAVVFACIIYYSSSNYYLTWIGTIIFTLSASVFNQYIQITSEAPFFLLYLLFVFLLTISIEKDSLIWPILAGISTGLAILTPYAGITLAIVGIISITLFNKEPVRKWLKRLIAFVAAFVLISTPWFGRNLVVSGKLTSRVFSTHPPTINEWLSLSKNILEWMVPDRLILIFPQWVIIEASLLILSILLLTGIIKGTSTYKQNEQANRANSLGKISVIFIFVYLVFLVISKTFFDPDIDFDSRQLVPVYISSILLIISTLSFTEKIISIPYLLFGSLILILSVVNIRPTINAINNGRNYGIGYTSYHWQSSETVNYLTEFDVNQINLIFTNQELALELHLDKDVLSIPQKYVVMNNTYRENTRYHEQITNISQLLRSKGGVIVYFNDSEEPLAYPEMDELLSFLDTDNIINFSDGKIIQFHAK